MTDITLMTIEDGRYSVDVTEGDVTTTHEVDISERLVDDLALDDVDAEDIVLESVAFLLDRETYAELPGRLDLEDIAGRYREEYYRELRDRLGT